MSQPDHTSSSNVVPMTVTSTSEIVMVTPSMATLWLTLNTVNRHVRNNKVIQYAVDMLDGNWKLTGEAIKFSVTGRLLDGQHRLQAIVEADVAVPMFVVRGLPDDTQPYMDSGMARLASDNFHMTGEAHPSVLAGAARIGILADRGLLYRDKKLHGVSHAQVYGWVAANPTVRRSVHYTQSGAPKKILLRPSIRAYCHFRFAEVDTDAADEFFGSLGSLVNIPNGSPIHAVDSRLRQLRDKSVAAEVRDLLHMMFRGWNAWRAGRSLQVIQLTPARGSKQLPPLA
jgi:hypothetical protein